MIKNLTFIEKISFSNYIGGLKLLYILVSAYATLYYITALGLNPVFISVLILVSRMFDAFNDPLIGALIDRKNTKLKNYLVAVSILLPLSTLLIFTVPTGQGLLTYGYVTFTYVIWSVLYTLGEVPIYSIASRMTDSELEQDRLLANSMLGGLGGTFIGLGMTSYFLKAGVDNIKWLLFAGSFAIVGFLILAISAFFIHERHIPTKDIDNNETVLTNLKSTLKDKHLYTIMLIFMSQLFINASGTLSVYVYDAYYGMPSISSIGGMVSLIGMIPIGICLPLLVKKIGKTNMMYFAASLMIIVNVLMYLLGNSQAGFSALLLLVSLSSLATVIPSLLRPLYTQEVINHRYKKDGTKNEASYFSVMTFFNKAGDALGASLGTVLLIIVQYDETIAIAKQSLFTIESMRFFVALGPVLMGLSWIIGLKYFYKLKNPKSIELDLLETEQYDIKL